MPDTTISASPLVTLTGTEKIPLSQGGAKGHTTPTHLITFVGADPAGTAAAALVAHLAATNPHLTTAAQVGAPSGSGTSTGANTGDETGARVATLLHAASAKTNLVDADEVNGTDSVVAFGLIRTTWANVKAYLKTYFDTIYAPAATLPMPHSAEYTFVLADANTSHLHPSADTIARTFTIPSNAAVPYPIGTALQIFNLNGAGVVTIAINTDTLRREGTGATGSRTLAANSNCVPIKVAPTEWMINGTASLT